ncbi:uncharacterized protein [Nicotiana tomentosiformis]|uniref:uncharacterized protein n=1 Tax=Nicotiana tomentosiformis TaxID=4098 RepID=UPI00388C7BF2
MVRRNGGIPKTGSSSKPKNYDLCHKCCKPGHFIKECPLLKQDQYKNNFDKAVKRNRVPNKRFKRKNVTDNVVKQALAAWGDSLSESEEENDHGDSSMMASDDDEDDDDDKVNFLDVQRNLKSYSPKKLMSLANVLIDAYHNLITKKDALYVELGEAEQTRDDLVIVVVDLKETIENLKKEKYVLDEKISNIAHEKDNLMVAVVDLKETCGCVRKEKEVLAERVANIEHERDDLLVVVVDLKEIIREPKIESRPENSQKEKEVTSEAHIKLESELNSVKSSLCAELEKNKQLHEELGKVKSDLEKSLKWTWSSDAITGMYTNNGETSSGLGSKGKRFPITLIASMLLYLIIGFAPTVTTLGTLKKTGIVKGSSLQWYMDSGCLKHMTGSNGKKGYILGVGRIGKSLSHSIKNVYYVNGLRYNLLSVSQSCDKGNKVEFVSQVCTVTNIVTGEVVLVAKRYKNIYVADFESLQNGDLNCLSAINDDAELWHRRLGHASFTLLNKLVRKDLVRGLPKSSFKNHKVCDACVKGKQVRSSFKPKREVSTSKSLDLLHMDLCGPVRVESRGGKKLQATEKN